MAPPKPIIAELPPEVVIYGSSESMREVSLKMDRIAGKEIIAKLLYQRSSTRSGPFVEINCPAIPSTSWKVRYSGTRTELSLAF